MAFRVVALVTFLLVPWMCLLWFVLPTKADRAAELRLLGKWGLYLPNSDVSLPPERIVEYLPLGQAKFYYPEHDSWRQNSAVPGFKSSWYVRRGVFVSTMQIPDNPLHSEQLPLTWIDEDNFVLRFPSLDGTETSIRYRRISESDAMQVPVP